MPLNPFRQVVACRISSLQYLTNALRASTMYLFPVRRRPSNASGDQLPHRSVFLRELFKSLWQTFLRNQVLQLLSEQKAPEKSRHHRRSARPGTGGMQRWCLFVLVSILHHPL